MHNGQQISLLGRIAYTECKDAAVCWTQLVSPTQTDEPIEMPLGLWIRVGPRHRVFDRGPDPPKGPLKCIRLYTQQTPAAAGGCRLVCRGSASRRNKSDASEWTYPPRGGDKCGGDAAFRQNS